MEVLVPVGILLLLMTPLFKHIYYAFEHGKWERGSVPDPDASVVNVESEPVNYAGVVRFKTTITFSDGFRYISHKTKQDVSWVGSVKYTLPEDLEKEIMQRAMEAHAKAVKKSK